MKDKYRSKGFSNKRSSRYDDPYKKSPPVETFAETFYYKKQINAKTQMVIILQDDEEIEGTIEWYDKGALKINRKDAPNLLLLKHNIKYLFKAEELE